MRAFTAAGSYNDLLPPRTVGNEKLFKARFECVGLLELPPVISISGRFLSALAALLHTAGGQWRGVAIPFGCMIVKPVAYLARSDAASRFSNPKGHSS
jgi:hypothetical protein